MPSFVLKALPCWCRRQDFGQAARLLAAAGLASARRASQPVQQHRRLGVDKKCSGLTSNFQAALLAPAAASSTSAAFVAWPGLASSSLVLRCACAQAAAALPCASGISFCPVALQT